jgi:hypothetical protein
MSNKSIKTIGSIGKEVQLSPGQEQELFAYEGQGLLNHMWFGGNFEHYAETLIRVYVDDAETPSIEMELFLGHGIGFKNDFGPWGTPRIGKTGSPSGLYNHYLIPFGRSIRVTAQLASQVARRPIFWWIIRGIENAEISLSGITLPPDARLTLQKRTEITVRPLEEFELAGSRKAGMLYQVTIAAQSTNFSFLEAILRAYIGSSKQLLPLSSGLEDYFLGTYYFNRGLYHLPSAGVTHLGQADYSFSAYRFHEQDPIFLRTDSF